MAVPNVLPLTVQGSLIHKEYVGQNHDSPTADGQRDRQPAGIVSSFQDSGILLGRSTWVFPQALKTKRYFGDEGDGQEVQC